MAARTVPTPEDVRAIVALDDDPTLRNLRITQGYHDLSEGMRARTGGRDISWTTLGTWASKTAGKFIRSEEVPAAFRALLSAAGPLAEVEEKLGVCGLVGLAGDIVSDVSTYIMVGNRVVFAELGGCFADVLQTLGDDEAFDQARLDGLLERYAKGDPQPDVTRWDGKTLIGEQRGGQSMLRDMATALYRAMHEPDPKTRAELLLLANAYGGIHEQTRLQTYIAGSLNAPFEEVLIGHVHDQLDDGAKRSLATTLIRPIANLLEKAWNDFATLTMMELYLPDGTIHLSRPLPPDPGGPLVPKDLEEIVDPTLRTVLSRYEALDLDIEERFIDRLEDRFAALIGLGHRPSHAQAVAVGAVDWVSLPQRMRYILTLFRMRAQDRHLIAQPFTDAQRVKMDEGVVPEGPL